MIVLLLRLYWEFFLVGLFSMGGGMATVPFLFDLRSEEHTSELQSPY